MARCEAKADHEFLARMSYVEIYNEEARSRTLTHAHARSRTHAIARVHVHTHARTHASYTYPNAGTRAQEGALPLGELYGRSKTFSTIAAPWRVGWPWLRTPRLGHTSRVQWIRCVPRTGMHPHVSARPPLAVAQVVLRSDDALEVLYEGEKNRHFAATAMNNHSSRR